MRSEYAPGATPIDPDEARGIIPAHLTLQRELNEYEEWEAERRFLPIPPAHKPRLSPLRQRHLLR
jgi:hypothetical protein